MASPSDAPSVPRRVLLVATAPTGDSGLPARLEALGYVLVGVAASVEEALPLLARVSPDVVLLDVGPARGPAGLTAAGRLRDRCAVPVVFLAAPDDASLLIRAGDTGPYGCVVKPVVPGELAAALQMALYKSTLERRLAERERWTAMTLEYLGEGVLTVDPDDVVRFANPAAARLLGREAGTLLGCKLETVYRTRNEWLAVLSDEAATDGCSQGALLCRADGRTLAIEETRSPIRDARGHLCGSVVVFHDISRRHRVEQELRRSLDNLRRTLDETVMALTVASEIRDPFTAGHHQRVSRLAYALAVELGFEPETREAVRLAGLVHDIGKIHVPSEILAKPEVLTPIEMGIMRGHSQVGYDILKNIPFPWPVARMVLEHHERQDGSGYPQGLRGEAMLPGSRILAVADVMEAMTMHRPYRAAWSLDTALDEIRTGRGVRYDPDVADACLRLFTRGGFRF